MVQSYSSQSTQATSFTLKGNQPLLLESTDAICRLKSGEIAIFATLVNDVGQPYGYRHYLFSVSPGEIIMGAALVSGWEDESRLGLLAVAVKESELQSYPLGKLASKIVDISSQNLSIANSPIALIEQWLAHLGNWLSKLDSPRENLVIGNDQQFLSLVAGQSLQPLKNKLIWVKVSEGETNWLAQEFLPVTTETTALPLTATMWLEATAGSEVQIWATSELEQPQILVNGIHQLHQYFLNFFCRDRQIQDELDFQRFQQRAELNQQVAESALNSLANIFESKPKEVYVDTTPLLKVAGAVGRALGITIVPPAIAQEKNRYLDPLQAIAKASLFQIRRVMLSGKWWEEDFNALLVYRLEDHAPLALLARVNNHLGQKSKYLLYDPETEERIPITEQVAETISPEAYMFYRPLPPKLTKPLQIFRFGVRGYEKEVMAIVGLGLIGSLLGMITPQATAMLVNNVIPDGDLGLLWQIGLALFAASFGKSLFQLAQGFVTLRVENAADSTLQPAIWDRLLQLSPAFFRNYSSGDLLNRLMAVRQVRAQISGATQRTLLSGIFALFNLILMFVYSSKLAMIAIAITALVITVSTISTRMLIRKQRQQEELDGDLTSLTVELIGGISKLRVAAAEKRAFGAWAKHYSRKLRINSDIQRINDAIETFTEALPVVSSVLLFWFAIFFIQSATANNEPQSFNAGTFLAFNAAFGVFLGGATSLSNTFTDILEIVPLWERALPIVETAPESNLDKANPGTITGRLALDRVNFRYRNDGPLILNDVSVRAEPGEFVAFVGPSGSGKSTIFRLLLGFESPLSGTVSFDGQDLSGLDIPALRRQLGVVLQNVRLSSGTIFDSIACGALVSLDEAWEAARMAGFAEDIEEMPMGMHTIVSEGGGNLSGGQRQRLLIARSLVMRPKVILMDEATSALDNRTQSIVTESLDRMNATRIVIAHRLSTIRNADRIYVIEAGNVVESGNYDELMSQDGLFARLVARQVD